MSYMSGVIPNFFIAVTNLVLWKYFSLVVTFDSMRKYIIQTFKIEEPRGYDHWVRFFLNGFLPSKFCEGGGIARVNTCTVYGEQPFSFSYWYYILYEIKHRKERCLILSPLAGVLVARFGNTCYLVLYTQHVYS